MNEEEKKAYEEAKLYLEHIGVDDFNLEKHQCENRKWAIETILKIVDNQQKEIEELKERQDYARLEKEQLLKDSISKDKIREKIKEVSNGTYDAKIILEKLLEE